MKLTRKRAAFGAAGTALVSAAVLVPITQAGAVTPHADVYFASVTATGGVTGAKFPAGTVANHLTGAGFGLGDYRVVFPTGTTVPPVTANCVTLANVNPNSPAGDQPNSSAIASVTATNIVTVHTYFGTVAADRPFDLIVAC